MSRVETIGRATLYLGDCREILPTLGKVDAVVTDPPYEFENPIGELPQKRRYILANGGQDTSIDHPTVKPLQVMHKIIANVAGQAICDPFMGSGSTGVAALVAQRDFIGIERNERYFAIACKRIEDAQRQGDLFMESAA